MDDHPPDPAADDEDIDLAKRIAMRRLMLQATQDLIDECRRHARSHDHERCEENSRGLLCPCLQDGRYRQSEDDKREAWISVGQLVVELLGQVPGRLGL